MTKCFVKQMIDRKCEFLVGQQSLQCSRDRIIQKLLYDVFSLYFFSVIQLSLGTTFLCSLKFTSHIGYRCIYRSDWASHFC